MVLVATAGLCGGWSALTRADSGTYPPSPSAASISVDKPTPAVGDSLTVTAKGLCPGVGLVFELVATPVLTSPTLTAASDGSASFVFTVPAPAGATRTVRVEQASCSIEVSTTVSVVSPPATTTPPTTTAPAAPTTVSPTATLTASPTTASSPITVGATGLCVLQTATFSLLQGVETLASQSTLVAIDGSASVTFPPRPAGAYRVRVTQDCGTSQSLPVAVDPVSLGATPTSTPSSGNGLPTAGAGVVQPIQLAVAVLLMGAGMMLVTRHRREVDRSPLRRLRSVR
jgi:hypothetical protein